MAHRDSVGKADVEKGVDEKAAHIESPVTEIGTFRVVGLSAEDAEFYTNYPEEKRKKVFRKVSFLNVPWVYQLTCPGRRPTSPHAGPALSMQPHRPCQHRQRKDRRHD